MTIADLKEFRKKLDILSEGVLFESILPVQAFLRKNPGEWQDFFKKEDGTFDEEKFAKFAMLDSSSKMVDGSLHVGHAVQAMVGKDEGGPVQMEYDGLKELIGFSELPEQHVKRMTAINILKSYVGILQVNRNRIKDLLEKDEAENWPDIQKFIRTIDASQEKERQVSNIDDITELLYNEDGWEVRLIPTVHAARSFAHKEDGKDGV